MLGNIFRKIFNVRKEFLFPLTATSLLFLLLLIFPILRNILTYSPDLLDFSEHIMSSATSANLNISSRITSYYTVLIGIAFLFFLIFFLLNSFFRKKNIKDNTYFITYIQNISLIGICGFIGSSLSAYNDFSFYFVGGAVLLSLIFFNPAKSLEIPMLLWNMLIAIPLSFFILVISKRFDLITKISSNLLIQRLELPINIIYFILVWFVLSIFIYFFVEELGRLLIGRFSINVSNYRSYVAISSIPILFTGIIQSFLLEIMNIVNKRFDIVLKKPNLMYGIVVVIAIVSTFIIFINLIKNKKQLNINLKKFINSIYLPAILITFTLIIAQPAKLAPVGNEFFEMANHGLSVDHLFKYGSLPIIETFDAHLLSNQLFAYIYSFFNGYEPWAAFLYDQYIQVFYILILYFILKDLIGEINSFFFIVSFSLIEFLFNFNFLLSAILVFCIYNFFRNNNVIKHSVIFWITAIFLGIYRLDLGVAALFAGVFTFLIAACISKKRSEIVKFLTVGMILGIFTIFAFALLCLIKGVNPLSRVVEIIKLCQSNQNWAYPFVGDNSFLAYSLGYHVFPVLVICILVFVLVKFVMLKRNILRPENNFIMFLFFSLFYLFNLSRGIVRHSLVEGTLSIISGTLSLSVLIFVIINSKKKRKLMNFLIASLLLSVMTNINLSSFKGSLSVTTKAISSTNFERQFTDSLTFNGTRIDGEQPEDASQLERILDATLSDKESYFDFSSSNYYYALVGRKNPIYANQSPLMLSGDKTQELALNELKEKKPAYVLMPISGKQWSFIDGIAVDYKYYLISEFIYDNYTPFIRLSNFDIYCLKEKKLDYLEILKNQGVLQKKIYSGNFNYLKPDIIESNDMIIEQDKESNIIISAQGNDPYLKGLISKLKNKVPNIFNSNNINESTRVKIKYETNGKGDIQLYYTFSQDMGFSEEQSYKFEVANEGKGFIELELPSMPNDIRLDTNVKNITLTGIEIIQGLNLIDNQPEIWTREVGYIPQLWAEQDRSGNYVDIPSLNRPLTGTSIINVSTSNIIKNQPVSLYLQIESEIDQRMSIALTSNDNQILAEFSFNISKGTHGYVVRLSSDYKWWSDEVRQLLVIPNDNVVIKKLNFFLEKEKRHTDVHLDD